MKQKYLFKETKSRFTTGDILLHRTGHLYIALGLAVNRLKYNKIIHAEFCYNIYSGHTSINIEHLELLEK
jgi:hypothetical protein